MAQAAAQAAFENGVGAKAALKMYEFKDKGLTKNMVHPLLADLKAPAALLAGDTPRSEQDLELGAAWQKRMLAGAAGIADIALHPVTGAFADPVHESAFAAHFYRLAFPFHAFLLGLTLVWCTWALARPALAAQPNFRASLGVGIVFVALGMAGRISLHRMPDSVRSQRMGARAWTLLILLMGVWVCWHVAALAGLCSAVQQDRVAVIVSLAYALITSTHGMAFYPKCSLIGLMVSYNLGEVALCGAALGLEAAVSQPLGNIAAHIIGTTIAHLGEMHLRHSYVETQFYAEEKRRLGETLDEEKRRVEERNEQLRAEKERLTYDVQRRTGRPLDDDDGRSPFLPIRGSAIRRGLQGEPSSTLGKAETHLRKITQIFHHTADDGRGSSKTRSLGRAPLGSPPPSLPPGPPSTAGSADDELLTKTNKSSKSSEPDHTRTSPNFSDTENVMPSG